MNSPLRYRLAAQTHIGMKRSGNEDNFGIFDAPGTDAAFVVADGMGGLQAGDVASAEAVRTIEQVLQERLADPSVDPSMALAEAIRQANDSVNALPRAGAPAEEPTLASTGGSDARKPTREFVVSTALMGTTAIAGVVRDGTLYLAHAGDSRAYLLRDNRLRRLTDDHSFVAERVKTGDMTEAEARRSRFRNMITRAIGIEATIQPDLIQETLQAEDLLLVCTDGLTTMLEDSDIAEILRAPRFVKQSLEQQVAALIDAANRRGGSDNTTVLLLRPQPEKSAGDESAAPAPVRRETSVTSRMTAADLSARQAAVAAPSAASSRRRDSPHPILVLLALVGGAALLAALGVSVSPDLRRALAANLQLMNGTPPQSGPRPVEQLAGLVYDPPTEFAKEVLARGDLLAYVPGVGLYFATNSTGKVACLDKNSEIVATFPTLEIAYRPTPSGEQFKTQTFLTGDGQGNLYVCHTERRLIEKFDRNGKLLWRSSSNPQIQLERPEAIAVDDEGNLYIVDTNHIRVLRARPRSGAQEAGAPASPPVRAGAKP